MTELIAKYLSGNASQQEIAEVERWRNENQQNAEALLEWSVLWSQAGSQVVEAGTAWEKVNAKLSEPVSNTPRLPFNSWVWKAAAAIVIAVGIGWFAFNQEEKGGLKLVDGSYTLTTVDGEIRPYTLPDGSTVTLNEGSVLEFPEQFDASSRNVKVSGVAFFEVERDETRPFLVETDNSTVQVLGTSFLVESAAEEGVTEVIVSTGKVALSNTPKSGKKSISVELSPGESGVVANTSAGIVKRKNKKKNYLSWKTRMMDFQGERLGDVFETLSDVYKVEVNIENEKVMDCRLSATFQDRSIEAVMEIIGNTFNLEYDINSSDITVRGEGCE